VARKLFFGESLFNDVLSGDSGMIGTWQPECFTAKHALMPDQDVLKSIIQNMPHGEHACHVWRRNNYAVFFAVAVGIRGKTTAGLPFVVYRVFYFGRIISLRKSFRTGIL